MDPRSSTLYVGHFSDTSFHPPPIRGGGGSFKATCSTISDIWDTEKRDQVEKPAEELISLYQEPWIQTLRTRLDHHFLLMRVPSQAAMLGLHEMLLGKICPSLRHPLIR
jgi:hypothetical protein